MTNLVRKAGRPPLPRPPVTFEGETVRIPLTQGFSTVVDATDWPRVESYTWCIFNAQTKWPYAVTARPGGHGRIMLHRLLLDAPAHLHVDHRDCNTLNNCRANLRLVTPTENKANQRAFAGSSSRFRGVFRHPNGRWRVVVMARGKRQYLGYFGNEIEAAHAADRVLWDAWGPLARLNFPRP